MYLYYMLVLHLILANLYLCVLILQSVVVQEKAGNMADKASNAAHSAKESCQDVYVFIFFFLPLIIYIFTHYIPIKLIYENNLIVLNIYKLYVI